MSAIVFFRECLQPAVFWALAVGSALRVLLLQPAPAVARTRV